MSKIIELTQGKSCIVDDEDFEFLNKWKWQAWKSPYGTVWYALRSVKILGTRRSNTIRMHRVIMGDPFGLEIDHKNHDGLDNRRENLRICTKAQNQQNANPQIGRRTRGVSFL